MRFSLIIVACILGTSAASDRHAARRGNLRKLWVTPLKDALSDLSRTISNWWDGLPNELDVKVWDAATNGDDLTKYPWPELQLAEIIAKENVGISISGGGARSMAAAWGQLSALHDAGIMKRARYLNGLSGGAWAVQAYTYASDDITDAELLGGIVDPSEATLSNLQSIDEKSLGFGATTDMFVTLVTQLVQSKVGLAESGELWVSGVQERVLASYGLKEDAFFAYDKKQVDDIKKRNPHL